MSQDDAAARERDEIATLLDSVGAEYLDWKEQLFPIAAKVQEWKNACVAEAVRAEREACARDAESLGWRFVGTGKAVGDQIAAAIRARGGTR